MHHIVRPLLPPGWVVQLFRRWRHRRFDRHRAARSRTIRGHVLPSVRTVGWRTGAAIRSGWRRLWRRGTAVSSNVSTKAATVTRCAGYLPHPPFLGTRCGLLRLAALPVQSSASSALVSAATDLKLVAKEEASMFVKLLNRMRQLVTTGVQVLHDRLRSWTKLPIASFAVGSIHDLARS